MRIKYNLIVLVTFCLLFIGYGVTEKGKINYLIYYYKRIKNETFLEAVENNHFGVAKALIISGIDINAQCDDRYTALTSAARMGNKKMIKMLLDAGANINGFNAYGRTALTEAAISHHTDIIQFLLNRGADVNAESHDGYTGLMEIASSGDIDMIKFFIKRGADVKAITRGSTWSVLTGAVINGHVEIVKLLISLGADINIKDYNGRTLIALAKESDHKDVITTLKEAGAPE